MTHDDPFASFGGGDEKTSSVSWKDAAAGTTIHLKVTEWPEQVQTTDFNTGEPEFWSPKNGEAQGRPKMAVVITGTVNGETRALWVREYPPILWQAIKAAQKTANARIEPGGVLTVTTQGIAPDGRARLFTASYKPANVFDQVAAAVDAEPVAAPPVAVPATTDPLAALKAQQATAKALQAQGLTAAQIAANGILKAPGGGLLGAEAVQAILNLA